MRSTLLSLVLMLCAAQARAHGDLHDQIRALTVELRAHPRDATRYHKRGELHRAHGEHAQALADYARAESRDPALQVVHLSRGRVLLEAGDAARAQKSLSRFLELQPGHSEAMLLRARAWAKLGQHADAERDFAALLSSVADPLPDLFLERAANLQAAGDVAAALAVLEEGLRRLGSLVVLEDATLDHELQLGRIDAALGRLDRLLASAPRKETLLARKAAVLEAADRREQAAAVRAQALAAIDALPEAKRKVPAMRRLADDLRQAKR